MNTVRMEVNRFTMTQQWLDMVGYTLFYAALVFYTIIFTWRFLKRVIFMAFLTILAPLVALTYPVDKAKDQKAQAFEFWFKEYTFNLIIQPVDLLLYIIIVESAIDLVEINMLYGIVAVGFLLQAEKFIKKMFGLEPKTNATSDFATGAVFGSAMAGLQKGSAGVTNALTSGNDQGNDKDEKQSKIRMEEQNQKRLADSGKDEPLGALVREKDKQIDVLTPEQQKQTGPGSITVPSKGKKKLKNSPQKNSLLGKKLKPKPLGASSQERLKKLAGTQKPMRVIRGLGRLRGRYINLDTAKKAARLAAMGLGAGTFGMLGVAAGLASDDFTNTYKLGALGAAAGAKLGSETVKQAESLGKQLAAAKDSFESGYFGKDYAEKVLNNKLDRKWYYSEETKNYYINKYGDNWKEKRAEALLLRKQGLTDKGLIDKAIKLKDKNGEFSIEEAGDIVNFAENITSRKELMKKGGEEKVYSQILQLVDGDKELADKAMKGIKKQLNIVRKENKGKRHKDKEVHGLIKDNKGEVKTAEEKHFEEEAAEKQQLEKELEEERRLNSKYNKQDQKQNKKEKRPLRGGLDNPSTEQEEKKTPQAPKNTTIRMQNTKK